MKLQLREHNSGITPGLVGKQTLANWCLIGWVCRGPNLRSFGFGANTLSRIQWCKLNSLVCGLSYTEMARGAIERQVSDQRSKATDHEVLKPDFLQETS